MSFWIFSFLLCNAVQARVFVLRYSHDFQTRSYGVGLKPLLSTYGSTGGERVPEKKPDLFSSGTCRKRFQPPDADTPFTAAV